MTRTEAVSTFLAYNMLGAGCAAGVHAHLLETASVDPDVVLAYAIAAWALGPLVLGIGALVAATVAIVVVIVVIAAILVFF